VENIHNLGGTILGSSRGGFKAKEMIAAIKQMKINQLYIIGGDGTHRGLLAL
jgi:6-phosphofructokinase 1